MKNILVIAEKEIRDGIRNRWILATALLLGGLSLGLAFLGSAPVGEVGASRLAVTVVSLASLMILLGPLIALMLSFDAIVGDVERGTLLLLLSYPLSRGQLILGKFVGHVSIFSAAVVMGYGVAALAITLSGEEIASGEWVAFLGLAGSSIMLGAAFISMGYLVSVLVKERATAAGIAIGLWLLFALLYDMVLLGILVADKGATLKPDLFNVLLLINPADAFRLFNLSGLDSIGTLSGMAALTGHADFSPWTALLALLAWVIAPLGLTGMLFRRKEI
ncbi:MAG: ABC transporter permease [Alphaproteobacteria bacterium]|nr:ABC transporter permease [Alphaproteobacteria bacterium]